MANKLGTVKVFVKLRGILQKNRGIDVLMNAATDDVLKSTTTDDTAKSIAGDNVINGSTVGNPVKDADNNDTVKESFDSNATKHSASTAAISAFPKTILHLPIEITNHICSYLTLNEVKKLRLVCKRLRHATKLIIGKALVTNKTLYPTYASLSHFFALIMLDRDYPPLVKTITLVSDAPRIHDNGAAWAWSVLEGQENVTPTMEDRAVKHYINNEHKLFCHFNDLFINTGGYRTLLTMLFARLINLHTVQVRDMRPNEHIPEFKAAACLKDLSFYHNNLRTSNIFYGEWQYDVLHRCTTTWKDEFGDEVAQPYSGPQSGCRDDIEAALAHTESDATVERI